MSLSMVVPMWKANNRASLTLGVARPLKTLDSMDFVYPVLRIKSPSVSPGHRSLKASGGTVFMHQIVYQLATGFNSPCSARS
jgi:hypothetical protein